MNSETGVNSALNLPIELILSVNRLEKEDIYITKNVIKFFKLSTNEQKLNQNDLAKTNKLIEHLNFIRFNHFPVNQAETKTSNKVAVTNFSLILLTNIPNHKIIVNQPEVSDENWFYHHKIELNDENGQILARQVFFKLNHAAKTNFQAPLCCRSNWIPPKSDLNNTINMKKKYIIRLNINCKNYDLMLFFYRLLFDKYPNFSKKNFSLFILNQQNSPDQVEFQLSLKSDQSVSVKKISNSNLIYKINDRTVFINVIRLLDGFLEEIEKNKIYSVYDPDQNKVYLIDTSKESTELFKTTGLAQCYFNLVNSSQKKNYMNNFSPNSNSSSSSEANSLDSGNWSCSTASANHLKPNFRKEALYPNSVKNLIYQAPNGRKYKKKITSFRSKNCDDDYDENTDNEEDERELKNLLRKASSSSMYALLAFRNKNIKSNSANRSCLGDSTKHLANSSANLRLKSVLSNTESNLSRKKSKSVTFMDNLNADFNENQRPKSTTPFAKNDELCYGWNCSRPDLDKNEDFYFKNSLIDRLNKKQDTMGNRPCVGITPESRFRRSHTLDLIRNSRMPLSDNQKVMDSIFLYGRFNMNSSFEKKIPFLTALPFRTCQDEKYPCLNKLRTKHNVTIISQAKLVLEVKRQNLSLMEYLILKLENQILDAFLKI
ncbi:hypothetical protein BpHYR1_051210 [Brachionus plicatilis]|uniref:FAM124 domain-containing protein n=1 Tax=Brachionus plicatilis TaxID=10195 RepID=A0A3M7S4W5_BRAPC|nr:hypothetical protein BpHYR1_051210 [Brachionus plicatilis]